MALRPEVDAGDLVDDDRRLRAVAGRQAEVRGVVPPRLGRDVDADGARQLGGPGARHRDVRRVDPAAVRLDPDDPAAVERDPGDARPADERGAQLPRRPRKPAAVPDGSA